MRNRDSYKNIPLIFVAVVAVAANFLSGALATPPQQSPSNAPAMSFLKPHPGTIVNSGDTLFIEIEGQGLKEVLLLAPHFTQKALNDGNGIFKFQYQIPIDTVGELKLSAIGKSISEPLLDKNFKVREFPSSAEITIIVQANQQINVQSIEVLSDFMSLKVGESQQIYVSGKLTDGSEINITPSQFGTQYITSKNFTKKYSPSANVGTEIIRVDNDGNVTGINPGEDSVIVSHKNTQSETVRVIVEQ